MATSTTPDKPRSDFTILDFPSLERSAKDYDSKSRQTRYHQHLLSGVATLAEGVELGSIRNMPFQELKHTLGTLIRHMWSLELRHTVHANEAEWDSATKDALNYIPTSSINDIRALGNKLRKLKQPGSHKDVLQAFVDEMQPLIDAVEYLKTRLVKGRAPSNKPPAPVNPDKDVKTCPCCFRSIAVRDGKMVHHGYQRPGDGYQTSSCFGTRFAPLEVSTKGLEWLIEHNQQKLKEDVDALEDLPNATKIVVLVQSSRLKLETYTPEHKDWKWACDYRKGELEGDIRNRKFNLSVYRRHLQEWITWHQGHGRSLDIPHSILEGED